MDYEKKYKDALERAKQFSEKPYLEDSKGIVDYIFPELKESEDEKIRKALIKLVKKAGEGYENVIDGVSIENAIAWLESNGNHLPFDSQDYYELVEQKPAWSEEDDSKLKEVLYYIEYVNKTNVTFQQRDLVHLINWLKSLKNRIQPQNRWKPSERQIKVCKKVYADVLSAKGFDLGFINDELNRLEEQLKKLRED